jgi:hypothetical protein
MASQAQIEANRPRHRCELHLSATVDDWGKSRFRKSRRLRRRAVLQIANRRVVR